MVKEWNLLRAVACLSVVLLHSTTQMGILLGGLQANYYDLFRIGLCYATPAFIVLSEIILANRYSLKVPSGFFIKRFKYIYIPFLVFSVIDGIVVNYFYPQTFLNKKNYYEYPIWNI